MLGLVFLLAWQSKIFLAGQLAAIRTEAACLALAPLVANEVAPGTVCVLAGLRRGALHWACGGAVSPVALAAYW